jgi:hypothetical protein
MVCALNCCLFHKVHKDQLLVWVVWASFYQRYVKVVQFLDVLLVVGELLGAHHFVDELEVFECVAF